MGIANRVAILSLTRLANYGLMLVSPILLVRLLSVDQFGQYREFLLYVGILQSVAVFGIPDSLLYFVAAHPQSPWRVVKHNAVLTLASTVTVVACLLVADGVTHGALVGQYRWPLAACTLCAANLDFWECFWVARRRPVAIFVYAAGRLLGRLAIVVVAAAVTHDVRVMIWGFVALEAVRLIASAVALRISDRSAQEPPLEHPWRDLLRYCMPQGTGVLLSTLARNLSSVVVVKLAGAPALAQYAIGRFGEPVVITLRNSISTVVVPEMVRRDRLARESAIELWQQGTVINTILLFPIAVLIARFAFPLVTTVFGPHYAEAATVMQIYMLVVVRECFDFAPPLRAAGSTTPFVASNVGSALVCGALLFILVPSKGVAGAMMAYAAGCFVDAGYLAWSTRRVYRIPLRSLVPWSRIARVASAATVASIVFLGSAAPVVLPPLLGDALAAVVYLIAFALVLYALRVPETLILLGWARRLFATAFLRGARVIPDKGA